MTGHLILLGCGTCRARRKLTLTIAADRENFERGGWVPCHECGATVCEYDAFAA